jgi:hypothetical protein
MYRGLSGNMEGARIRKLLISLTEKQGKKYDSPSSVRDIEPFIRFHNLDMYVLYPSPLPSCEANSILRSQGRGP